MNRFNKDEIPATWKKEELLNWCQMYLERVDMTAEVLAGLLKKSYDKGVSYGEQHPSDGLEGMGLLKGKCGAWTS